MSRGEFANVKPIPFYFTLFISFFMLRYGKLIPRFKHSYDAPEGIGIGSSVEIASAKLAQSLNKVYSGRRFADGVIFSSRTCTGDYEACARLLNERYAEQFTEHDLLVPAGIAPHVMIFDSSDVGSALFNFLKSTESYKLELTADAHTTRRMLEFDSAFLRSIPPGRAIKRRPLVLVANHEVGTTLTQHYLQDFWNSGIEGCIVFGHFTRTEAKRYESLGVKILIPLEQFTDPVSYIASKLGRFCLDG